MKHILLIILLLFIPIATISSQENKSRFGVEVDIIPWYFDTFSRQSPTFSISGFIGGYYEHFFSNSFSFKTTVGVHNANYKMITDPHRSWQTFLELKVEPRFYFWENQQTWGNIFTGLPVSIATGPFQYNGGYTIFQTPTLQVIPIVGYQYYFTPHVFVELNAGLGWSHQRYPKQNFDDFDYLVGARFGFSF